MNVFKIGQSINPSRRLKNLQTGNSRLLKIYHTIVCPSKQIAKNLEGALHVHYLSKCTGGEWFNISIDEIKKSSVVSQHLLKHDLPMEFFEDVWDIVDVKKNYSIPHIAID